MTTILHIQTWINNDNYITYSTKELITPYIVNLTLNQQAQFMYNHVQSWCFKWVHYMWWYTSFALMDTHTLKGKETEWVTGWTNWILEAVCGTIIVTILDMHVLIWSHFTILLFTASTATHSDSFELQYYFEAHEHACKNRQDYNLYLVSFGHNYPFVYTIMCLNYR